jgi:predicted glycoside hydrolase/deacetylase ChbG (UPF0249 family)
MIKLIINADDFGYSKLFNKSILELIKDRKITSTSVMVDYIDESQQEQVSLLKIFSNKKIVSVGLHIDFKSTDFGAEVRRQFEKFNEIFSFEPRHIDIHKSTYMQDGYTAIQNFAKSKRIPCKNLSEYGEKVMSVPGVITTKAPVFSGTDKSIAEIRLWLSEPKENLLFINFHPGYYDPESKSSLNKEREMDAQKIIEINDFIRDKNFKLVSFNVEDLDFSL